MSLSNRSPFAAVLGTLAFALAASPVWAATVGEAVTALDAAAKSATGNTEFAENLLESAMGGTGPGGVAGTILVPDTNEIEQEPNNSLAQAQAARFPLFVSGAAAFGDAGFQLPGELPGVQAEDLFGFTLTEFTQFRLTLTIGADDLVANDLDLLFLDNLGNVLFVSQGEATRAEVLEIQGSGTAVVAVRAFSGSSSYVLAFEPTGGLSGVASDAEGFEPAPPTFVAGDLIAEVKAAGRKSAELVQAEIAAEHDLDVGEPILDDWLRMAVVGADVEEKSLAEGKIDRLADPEAALAARTVSKLVELRRDPRVAAVQLNRIVRAAAVPNDQFYNLQWHYPLIKLPQAWDLTTGNADVIAAVIDTGILSGHPDINDRIIAGYDFVSNPANSGDGDGIDPNPEDNGTAATSFYHGTHVAGTVGAETNNTQGVAGVTWATRLMNLRVLGANGSGSTTDIVEAIKYAARLANASGTLPPERADVINMSLGGAGTCDGLSQAAINAARAAGVGVIVAAGNENTSADTSPASCDGAVSTSAVDLNLNKAPYSNFGPRTDVAAPGGDTSVDRNADGFVDGVLSTLKDDNTGEFNFVFYQGTSMASPHVAGVYALMQGVHPGLTPGDFDLLLAGTHPMTSIRITQDKGVPGRDDIFGHGLIDALGAVRAAQELAGNAPMGSILNVTPTTLDFGDATLMRTFAVSNAGTGTLNVTSVTDDQPWLTVSPTSGTAPRTFTATVDRTGLADGAYEGTITVESDATLGANSAQVTVKMQVGTAAAGNVGEVIVIAVDPETFENRGQTMTSAALGYAYTLNGIEAGTYLIVAGTDRDGDNVICDEGEACGATSQPIPVTAGKTQTGVSFVVANQSAIQLAGVSVR